MYYLQSRYYNAEIGRFINADAQINLDCGFVGVNMYTYCVNNPVIYRDDSGQRPVAGTMIDGLKAPSVEHVNKTHVSIDEPIIDLGLIGEMGYKTTTTTIVNGTPTGMHTDVDIDVEKAGASIGVNGATLSFGATSGSNTEEIYLNIGWGSLLLLYGLDTTVYPAV